MNKSLSSFLEEMKKKKETEKEDTFPTTSANAMDAPTPMHIMNPTNTSSSINGDTSSDKRPSLYYKKKEGDQYDLTGNSRRRKLYVHRIDEERFINGREYASHGLMHPEHAKMALHQKTGNTIDFYAHGTGDKISGKVIKNDGKNVHMKDTSGKIHQFKVRPHLPKKTNEELELDEARGRKSAAAKASGEEGDTGDNNIIYQMRKVINLRGQHDVKFDDGSKMKMHPNHAKRVISHYTSIHRPIDKQAFTNKLQASSKAMKKHLETEDVGGIDGATDPIYNPRSNWGDTVKTSGLTREGFNESFASFVEAMGYRDPVVTSPKFSQAYMPINPTDPVSQPTSHAIPMSSMEIEADEVPDERDNGASVYLKNAIRSLLKREEIVDPKERERMRNVHSKNLEKIQNAKKEKLASSRENITRTFKQQTDAIRKAHQRKMGEDFNEVFGQFITEAGFPARGKQDTEGDRMGVSTNKSPEQTNKTKEKTIIKGNSKQDEITLNPILRIESEERDDDEVVKTKVRKHRFHRKELSKIVKEGDFESHSAPIPWVTDESHDVGKSEKLYQKVREALSGKKLSEEAEQVDEISIGKMVDYSTKARTQMLKHSRLFKGNKVTPADDAIIAKRKRGDELAGKKLERKYKAMDEAKDSREYDYEGDMAISQLKTMVRHAEHLMSMLKPNTNLPEWVQSKITLAQDYVQTAHDYMMSETNESTINEAFVAGFELAPFAKDFGIRFESAFKHHPDVVVADEEDEKEK